MDNTTWDSEEGQRIAGKIGNEIARSMNWERNGVAWFAFHSNTSDDFGFTIFKVSVLLGSKRKFDLKYVNAPAVDLNSTLLTLAQAVRQGELSITVNNSPVVIKSLSACETQTCNSTYLHVNGTSPPFTSTGSKIQIFFNILLLICVTFLPQKFRMYA